MRCCRAEPDQDAVLGSPPDPLATNGVWVKGGHPALRMWMGVGVLRETGTKVYLHQPWTPHGGWSIPHPWCFLCSWNGSLVGYLLDRSPFVLYFPPVPWPPGERRRDSKQEGRATAPSLPVQMPLLPTPPPPPPRGPTAPRAILSPWWILPSVF